jgi:hypothetical protein
VKNKLDLLPGSAKKFKLYSFKFEETMDLLWQMVLQSSLLVKPTQISSGLLLWGTSKELMHHRELESGCYYYLYVTGTWHQFNVVKVLHNQVLCCKCWCHLN